MLANSAIRLVIADASPIFRAGLVYSIDLRKSDSIRIVGEAPNGEALVQEVERKKPDVVLTDIRMPFMSGVEASRIINAEFSFTSVIALTMFTDPDSVYEMFKTGAKGYLSKTAEADEIIEAIQAVHAGDMHYCSSTSMNLVKKIGTSKYNQYKKNQSIHFTEKEIQFIRLICLELTTKEIADKMKIGIRTAEEYSHKIKEKIEAKSLVGIALYALKNNIVSAKDFQ